MINKLILRERKENKLKNVLDVQSLQKKLNVEVCYKMYYKIKI